MSKSTDTNQTANLSWVYVQAGIYHGNNGQENDNWRPWKVENFSRHTPGGWVLSMHKKVIGTFRTMMAAKAAAEAGEAECAAADLDGRYSGMTPRKIRETGASDVAFEGEMLKRRLVMVRMDRAEQEAHRGCTRCECGDWVRTETLNNHNCYYRRALDRDLARCG